MALRGLHELQRTTGLDWRKPTDWSSLLRATRLLLHPAAFGALLELDIVKGTLFQTRGPAALSFLTRRHVIARTLSLRQRLGCTLYHYRYEQATFASSYIDSVYRADGLELWRQAANGHLFDIRLMVGNDNLHEGFLSAVAFIDGQRVCVMSFSYVDAALFGWPAGPTLFVTRKQSGRHPEHLRFFARTFKHTSPPYFCFAAVDGIARALGIRQIALIRHHAHPNYSREHAEVMRKSYDEFWESLGASELDQKAFRAALPLQTGDPLEISPTHRTRARKRRKDRLAVQESACAVIRGQLAPASTAP